jgi:hypothetical protein
LGRGANASSSDYVGDPIRFDREQKARIGAMPKLIDEAEESGNPAGTWRISADGVTGT